ncbi:type II toxin-antitoxin system Phd/YefM family antitoxin [Paraburkholderia bryophila]|uniref:Antitoxin Phd_YefM of type II toxin-antitoxin system n=1 Tax=Paraburkholderia bryophila TaxID=420952 RepID=A0A7Y9WHD0_9BURK|nr:type II toxin-antitoxin system Phd/YefM family antitoxin [Paraburkholderia bryophila]NYH20415.1 hypothetical protein [Paraburkholderia bryophila]
MIRTVMERFVEHSPMAVMARLVMQWALHAESLDDPLGKDEPDNDGEPLRELLLSMTVQAMTQIAARQSRSRDAFPDVPEETAAQLTALHDRMSRVRAQWGRSLVRDSAGLLLPVAHRRTEKRSQSVGDLRVRVLDGVSMSAGMRCMPGPAGCVHVIASADAQPGAVDGPCVLPVYDPELALIVDLLPYERGFVHERAFAAQLVESVRPGELWILDGHFNPAAILSGWPCDGSLFVVQEHGCTPAYRALDEPREAGWLDGAPVCEQPIGMPMECGASPVFRRIEWHRIDAESGTTQRVVILTNVPATTLDAPQIVQLATRAWRDTLPLPLDAVCEGAAFGAIASRATPLASGIVALAFNVFSAMIGVVKNALDLDERDSERLPLHMASGIEAAYGGMMIALPPDNWRRYDRLPDAALRDIARHLAVHVDPRSMRRKRRDHKVSAKSQARLLATTLEHLLREDAELAAAGFSRLRTIAMATRDFSSNPSRALRHASDALVMVTKYNRPVALLVSIDDWNRLIGQVRETNFDRLSIDYASLVPMSGETVVSDLH